MTHLRAHGDYASCQDGCGLFHKSRLLPHDGVSPGFCPNCGGETCDCAFCMQEEARVSPAAAAAVAAKEEARLALELARFWRENGDRDCALGYLAKAAASRLRASVGSFLL